VKILRSLAAVAVGYAVMAAVIRYFAPAPSEGMQYFLFSAACIAAASMLGGLATALVADGHELAHAAGLGFVMIVMSIVSMRRAGEARPGWYETSIAACGPMAALLGAAIRLLLKRRHYRGGNVDRKVPKTDAVH
jgi:hypothetical protein